MLTEHNFGVLVCHTGHMYKLPLTKVIRPQRGFFKFSVFGNIFSRAKVSWMVIDIVTLCLLQYVLLWLIREILFTSVRRLEGQPSLPLAIVVETSISEPLASSMQQCKHFLLTGDPLFEKQISHGLQVYTKDQSGQEDQYRINNHRYWSGQNCYKNVVQVLCISAHEQIQTSLVPVYAHILTVLHKHSCCLFLTNCVKRVP